MKKAIVLLLFFGAIFSVNAQSQMQRVYTPFRFGIQASPMFTWMEADDRFINSNGQNLGFRVGVKLDYFFAPKYAISTGLNLGFNQGGRLLHDYGGDLLRRSDLLPGYHALPNGTNIRYNINYIDIPVGLHLLTNEIFRDTRFFFQIPVFNFGILYNAKGTITGPGIEPLEREIIGPDVVPVTISWGLGGGVEYNVRGRTSGDTNIFAGLFYNQGFTDLTKKGTKLAPDGNGTLVLQDEDSKAILRGITLLLGIMF
jgi:hypothetical protein